MISIVLDAAALIFLVAAVNDNEQVDWLKAGVVGLVMSFVCGLAFNAMAASFGLSGALFGLAPVAALAGLVAWLTLGLTLQRAMIVGVCFLVWKIAIALVFAWALT